MQINTVINVAILIVVVAFLYTKFKPVAGVKNLNSHEFRDEIKRSTKKVVIDVREVDEYKRGYIQGAVNLPLSQLGQRLNEVPKDNTIFLYCQSGMRSKSAAKMLSKKGYLQINQLQGGISTWRDKLIKSRDI